jgi:NitT/TauT family transport system substrate-binding protein
VIRNLNRRRVMQLAGAGAAASIVGIRGARAADKANVLLDWRVTAQHTPFYVGLDQGIFQKHGIDLTVSPGNGSRNTILAVAANNVMFGSADATALPAAVLQGADVKMFCNYMATTPFAIMFKADSGITKPKDLEGRIYGDFPGSATYALFPAFAKKTGIDLSKVQITNISPATQATALIDGQIAATYTSLNDSFVSLSHRGVKLGNFSYAEVGLNLLSHGLLASSKTLENKDLVKRMAAAFNESVAAAKADIPKAAAATKRLVPEAPAVDVMIDMLKDNFGKRLTNPRNASKPPGWMVDADWADTINLLSEYGVIKEKVEISRLFTNDYLAN